MYADVCAKLDADLKQFSLEVNFRRALLEQCQESFTLHLEAPQIDECLDYEEQYELLVKYKTKMLGNVRLIAHLLRLRMLAAKIIFHCAEELVSIGSPEALETLCAFLETLGSTFDKPSWSGYARLNQVFLQVELLSQDSHQSSRIRCLLKDLLDKRRNGWKPTEQPQKAESSAKSTTREQGAAVGSEATDWMDARLNRSPKRSAN